MNDEYGVYFLPERASQAYRAGRRRIYLAMANVLIGGGLAVLSAYLFSDYFGSWFWTFVEVSLMIGAVRLGYAVIRWLRVRRDTERVAPGLAVGLNRDGMLVGQRWLPWAEVGQIVVKPHGYGASDEFVATARDLSVVKLPLKYTDALLATLDAAIRVLSGGRAWVDLSLLD